MESYALLNLGEVHEQSGDLRRALSNYSDSLEIEWERKEHTELTDRLNMIGQVYARLGRYADAMVYLEQAKVHIAAANDPRGRGYNLYNLGQIHRAKGNYRDAVEAFLGSIPLLQETGNLPEAAAAHEELSRIYTDQGRYEEASQSVAESLAVSKSMRIPARIAQSRIEEARLLAIQGHLEESERALAAAENVLHGLDADGIRPLLKLVQGTLLRKMRDTDEAASALREARTRSQQNGHLLLELESSLELARARLDASDAGAAEELLTEVLDAANRRRLRPIHAEALAVLAEVYVVRGESQGALSAIESSIHLATCSSYGRPRLMEECRTPTSSNRQVLPDPMRVIDRKR